MKTPPPPKTNPEIAVRVSRKNLSAYEFYSRHYEIPVLQLMQSEVYGQATTILDDPFGVLEWMESLVESRAPNNLVSVPLEFCPDVLALLERIAHLLRRPLEELAESLLEIGGHVLADHIQKALAGDGMDGEIMKGWADAAIDFRRHSKRNHAPGSGDVPDGWDNFNLKRPPRWRHIEAAR